MKRLLGIAALASFALSACVTSTSPPKTSGSTDPVLTVPTTTETINAVAASAATVADALKVAPPATLSKTTIDEKAIRLAFKSFDRALYIVDSFVAGGKIDRNSPTALMIRSGILRTLSALNAASAAQRAGNATTYTAALREAQIALRMAQTAITQGN